MDSSDLQGSISNSISSNNEWVKEDSAMTESRRLKFFSTYQSQEFSLPDSIMFYLTKNPPSSQLYEKMVQTCKYFFVKNPILVISNLDYSGDGKWELFLKHRKIVLLKITFKLWITDRLHFYSGNSLKNNLLSSVMPKLYQCDAKYVSITNQIISFNDLSLLISSAEEIYFRNVNVKNENDFNVAVEKIVETAIKAKRIHLWSNKNLLNITSETMKKLIKIPHFSKLDKLTLNRIPEAFDLEAFYAYMKKNKPTKLWLEFDDSISEAYKNRLVEIIDEIHATKTFDFKPPVINFYIF